MVPEDGSPNRAAWPFRSHPDDVLYRSAMSGPAMGDSVYLTTGSEIEPKTHCPEKAVWTGVFLFQKRTIKHNEGGKENDGKKIGNLGVARRSGEP